MNWKKISEKVAFKGWRGMLQKTFELPDGKRATFDVIQSHAFVTIVAFTKNKEAILIRQYRPGPEQILTSFPEGGIEEGEDPKVAAVRELLEETGYQAKEIIHLKNFRAAYSTELQVCVLALNCERVKTQQLDTTEFIEVFCLPIEKFRLLLTNREDDAFHNVGAGYLALDYLGWL